MIKRTIEISGQGMHLSIEQSNLIVKRDARQVGHVPVEDVGVLILDNPGATYTHAVLTELLAAGAVIVPCGRNHHPCALFLPQENTLQTQRVLAQARAGLPLRKNLWKQVVQAKLTNQAAVLPEGSSGRETLQALAAKVRSGDPDNIEGQAAKLYWSAFGGFAGAVECGGASLRGSAAAIRRESAQSAQSADVFRRHREGPPPNNLLNYGYVVMRAAVARAICGAGLHPSLGLHHKSQYNSFCLADDLLEPLRPLVDRKVLAMRGAWGPELTREMKAELLTLLTAEIEVAGEKGPLMVALTRMTASLVRCYEGQSRTLELPTLGDA